MQAIEILRPAVLLGVWTLVMSIWLVTTRMPALTKAKVRPDQARNTANLNDLLPHEVQRVAHNYNHLFEQPTLFYAIVLVIAVLDHVDSIHVGCAWAFLILRVVHSCIQATIDFVPARFTVFGLSWVALGVMLIREAIALF